VKRSDLLGGKKTFEGHDVRSHGIAWNPPGGGDTLGKGVLGIKKVGKLDEIGNGEASGRWSFCPNDEVHRCN